MKAAAAIIASLMSGTAIAHAEIIEGQVRNGQGASEAGVWVIAETNDLGTPFRKIVVTNDDGRFVLPELPSAEYKLWVRGYGLVDSAPTPAPLGANVTLEVETASSPQEAALVYPANYWMSMFEGPTSKELKKAGKPYDSSQLWLDQFKLNCMMCHQIGSAPTRFPVRTLFDSGVKKAVTMNEAADQLNRDLLMNALEKWGKKLAKGEVPKVAPPRPQGIERNFVITEWEWGDSQFTYSHDEVSTDKRNPELYANSPIYGNDLGNDYILSVDPVKNTASKIKLPSYENAKPWSFQTYKPLSGGEEISIPFGLLGDPAEGGVSGHAGAYDNPANPHNPMMDDTGKLWLTMQIRREWGEDMPEFCKDNPKFAEIVHHRQLGYYDTKTGKIVRIDTCYGTHHLQFDKDGVLWTSGDSHFIGWFDPKKFDPDKPETLKEAQGWSEGVIDTDGDGKPDKPIIGFRYSVIPNAADGTVWMAMPPGGLYPDYGERGYILYYNPKTDVHEAYKPPLPGAMPRGVDVSTDGLVWVALSGSGHLGRFDRSKCKQTWGAGDQCPEGWTLWETPGPDFVNMKKGANNGSNDMHYYIWVDQFNTLGMGENTVFLNGTTSDSLIAFRPDTQKFTVIRVPYPMVTYTRGLDGRIDDKNAGWKGRGLWFTNGLDPMFMSETQRSYVGKVQLRPDPLAH